MTLQKKATIIASLVATLLVFIKLAVGIISGSVAVLASAIDSILDIFVSLFNYFAIHKSEKKPDEKFNYGLGKLEALATMVEGIIIMISGGYIFYEAINKALNQQATLYLTESIGVMAISLIITGSLVLFLNHAAQKTGNMVVKADALHYKTDVLSNGAVLVSLLLISLTGFDLIDSLMGGVIAIYIFFSAYDLIKEGTLMLMDVAMEEDIVNKIRQIIEDKKEVTSYHHLKTRKSGNNNFVDLHLVLNPEISLLKAHRISDHVEEDIKKLDTNANWTITIHLDPYDDSEVDLSQIEPSDSNKKG